MIFLLISIICSVTVGILFKIIKANSNVTMFMITINYLIATTFAYFAFNPKINLDNIPFEIVIPLSILLPGIFWFLTFAIHNNGIIKTDIAQRLSLIIPAICSFWIFNEVFSTFKIIGILIGLLSMLLIINNNYKAEKNQFWYLLIVFIGYGVIDVLFKITALKTKLPYTTTLFYIFIGSLIVSIIFSLLSLLKKQPKSSLKATLFYGSLLGLLNFSNIFFYLKSHQHFKENPITVFASMNFGVIILGTIVGYFYFKEKMSTKNIVGIILALIAVGFIIISQLQ